MINYTNLRQELTRSMTSCDSLAHVALTLNAMNHQPNRDACALKIVNIYKQYIPCTRENKLALSDFYVPLEQVDKFYTYNKSTKKWQLHNSFLDEIGQNKRIVISTPRKEESYDFKTFVHFVSFQGEK